MPYSTALFDQTVEEEGELVFDAFTRDDAWELGTRMRSAAAAAKLPVVIGISIGQQRVFHAALPGAVPDNDTWLERKARTALHFERSTMGLGEKFRSTGRVFDTDSRLPSELYAAVGGAFPIRVRGGSVIGTVTVSGLPQIKDHGFVVEQLRAFLAR